MIVLAMAVLIVAIYFALREGDVRSGEGERWAEELRVRRFEGFEVVEPPALSSVVSPIEGPYDWEDDRGPLGDELERLVCLSFGVPPEVMGIEGRGLSDVELEELRRNWREDVAARWGRSVGEVEELDS